MDRPLDPAAHSAVHPAADPLSEDAAVLAFVATRDAPCPSCHYNLRALTQPRCPECGEPLRLKVTPTDPKLGLWLAMLIPLILGAGIGLLILLLIVRGFSIFDASFPARLAYSSFIASIPASLLLLGQRRRVTRAPVSFQVALAIFLSVYLVVILLLTYPK